MNLRYAPILSYQHFSNMKEPSVGNTWIVWINGKSKCPSADKWIKKLVHIHNEILFGTEKEGIPTLCNSPDGSGK